MLRRFLDWLVISTPLGWVLRPVADVLSKACDHCERISEDEGDDLG